MDGRNEIGLDCDGDPNNFSGRNYYDPDVDVNIHLEDHRDVLNTVQNSFLMGLENQQGAPCLSKIDVNFKRFFEKFIRMKIKGKKASFLSISESYCVLLKIMQDLMKQRLDQKKQQDKSKDLTFMGERIPHDTNPGPGESYEIVEIRFVEIFKKYCEILKILDCVCTPQLTFISILHMANLYSIDLK